jgi:hypothetical protein
MTTKPRAPLNLAFPSKGAASPRPDVTVGNSPAHEPPAAALPVAAALVAPRLEALAPKVKNGYAALTIRPGPERRERLEGISRTTGHSMQDILLHCFDAIYPPK